MADNDVRIRIVVENDSAPGIAAALASLGLLAQQARQTGQEGERASDIFGKLGSTALAAGRSLANAAANAGKYATAITGAAAASIAFGKAAAGALGSLANLVPLVSLLPSLAAGAGLVIGTLKLAGPGLAKAFEPITRIFVTAEGEASKFAKAVQRAVAIDVKPAAAAFARLNMPAITLAMDRIAYQTNLVVAGSLKWANSAPGIAAIKSITTATADAFASLTPKLIGLVEAFGNLAGRAGPTALKAVGDAIGRIVDRLAEWANNTSVEDIKKALSSLSGYGAKLRETFGAIRDVGQWMADNQGKVKAFADVVASATIAIGIATGNIPAILAGSASLIINHLDTIKEEFGKSAGELSHIFDGSTMPAEVLASWNEFSAQVGPTLGAEFERITKAISENKESFIILGRFVADYVIPILGYIALDTLVFLGKSIANTITVIGSLVETFRFLYIVVKGTVIEMALTAVNAFDTIVTGAAKAFGWIPGIGPKLKAAAAEVHEFVQRVNNELKNIRDEDVYVRTHFVGGQGQSRGGDYRTGGITGGMSYAATGGVRSGLVRVGEEGAELIRTPTGSSVYPRANTNQLEVMAAQQGARGGWGGPLLIGSDGSRLGDLLIEVIGVAMRGRGGDPGLLGLAR